MKTTAVRIHGRMDLRLESFMLPDIKSDEILARVVTDSICMSTYKAACMGTEHKRVHDDIADNPAIIGHEFCGDIISVGERWRGEFTPGERFKIQPSINYNGSLDSPGYSYKYCGGDATYIIIPREVMETGSLLHHTGAYYAGSLTEPVSCIIGAYNASFHTNIKTHAHEMGIRRGGVMAILGGAGPMGLAATDCALHGDVKPGTLIITDINEERLSRAAELFTEADARENGVRLRYINTKSIKDDIKSVISVLTAEAGGLFDDVFVFAPDSGLVSCGSCLLARDGCLNFFAGPADKNFTADINFFDIHYSSHHVVGTSGGSTDDMIRVSELTAAGRLNPAAMVTHIGGLNCVADTVCHLPEIKGGKKLIYTHIEMPLTAISDFGTLTSKKCEYADLFKELATITETNNGLWCAEAEQYLLSHMNAQ